MASDLPRLETRGVHHYLAIPATSDLQGMQALVPALAGELFQRLDDRNIAPAGPLFIRYRVIDMPAHLEIEVGVPVPAEASADTRVIAGVLPEGRYATLIHTGPPETLVDANAALQKWAGEQGIVWDVSPAPRGEAWGARFETYLTDPASEPDPNKSRTELAYLTAR